MRFWIEVLVMTLGLLALVASTGWLLFEKRPKITPRPAPPPRKEMEAADELMSAISEMRMAKYCQNDIAWQFARARYEDKIANLIAAMRENGRFIPGNPHRLREL